MADVRSKTGAAITSDFGSSSGTPIVCNQTTGEISVMKSDNSVFIIGSDKATIDQVHYVGTTSIAANRASAAQALTGITSIDGSAASLTNTAGQKLPTITGTVAASALTIGASSIYLDFRSATLGDGTISTVLAAPTSLVVPSTATLGTISAQISRLIVLEMNNAGTAELAVVNISGGNNLDETTLISTTAISATADLNNIIYSTTARTNLPFRVVGYIESTQATAGTWATAPSTIQGAGGNTYRNMQPTSMVRLNTSNGYGSTNTMIRRFTNIVANQGTDITYTDSAANGASFTINTNGVYAISYSESFNAASDFGISINSTQLTTAFTSITVTNRLAQVTLSVAGQAAFCSATSYMSAGDIIRAHTGGAAGGTVDRSAFIITRV